MKILLKIVFIIIIYLNAFWIHSNITYAVDNTTSDEYNLKTWWAANPITHTSTFLKSLYNSDTDFNVAVWWQKWIYNTLIRIARDLKNIFFTLASIYFLIIVIRLLFSSKTEEEVNNFKKWIIWISVWIIVTQVAYYIATALFDKEINTTLAENFIEKVVQPLISLLETAASFFFLAIMIYAFFRIVTANWDETKVKSWQMSVFYAVIWFIVIRISWLLVKTIYWTINTNSVIWSSHIVNTNIKWFAAIIVGVINWMNSFLWIVVVLMIIYAGFLALTSFWDEEKLKKTKKIIIYVIIWLLILVTNYLILTFFIYPQG